ncbi:hypothetical protein MNBD_PLANCTO02-2257 [hydrothermal vent metagenome]|uniref:Uncharacterized protein n=1 Tax=hydrothermal vent metagenome TaxID=652676 RepID=A0A3B1DLZ4_9ZZZZ
MPKLIPLFFLMMFILLFRVTDAFACPFCPAPMPTLSERYARADVVLLVQWIGKKERTKKEAGQITFELLQVAKQKKEKQAFQKREQITIKQQHDAKKGTLFLLMGHHEKKLIWSDAQEITETAFYYIQQAPSPEVATKKRLHFFLKFLEYHDSVIADDAYTEIANASYQEIVAITEKLSRKKLRKWLTDKETLSPRFGLYGMLLGLCGTKEDIPLLEKIITQPVDDELRLGMDGVMGGYLLLTGAKGLTFIEKEKFYNKKCPASETYSAMQALRFMWTYGNGHISKDRLRKSMRNLVSQPQYADLAIADLARWKDWTFQEKLMKLYDKNDYKDPTLAAAIRLSIVRYLLASTIDYDKQSTKPLPQHVIQCRNHIKTLRKKDPKTVKRAERFFSPE